MDWPLVLLLGLAVLAGGVVQSTIGFGLAVVAAPVVVLLAPHLMPAALLLSTEREPPAPSAASVAWEAPQRGSPVLLPLHAPH